MRAWSSLRRWLNAVKLGTESVPAKRSHFSGYFRRPTIIIKTKQQQQPKKPKQKQRKQQTHHTLVRGNCSNLFNFVSLVYRCSSFFLTVKHTHVQWSNPSENLISAWDFLLVVSLSYFFPPTVPLGRCPLSLDGSDWSAQVRQVVIHQKPPSSEEQRKAKQKNIRGRPAN